MTARDLIRDAMQEIGAIASGESVRAADAQVGLQRLNSLLSLWQTERLTIYALVRSTFGITAGQSSYTIGPAGGDWTLAIRPQTIEQATILIGTGETSYETPLELLSDADWNALLMKSQTSTLPTKATYAPTVPLGTFELYPVPSVDPGDVVLYVPTPLSAVNTLDTDIVFAPGYEEAVRYNLAVRLAPVFGRALDPVVGGLAIETKAQIKRANVVPSLLRVDDALMGDGGSFNWMTGNQA